MLGDLVLDPFCGTGTGNNLLLMTRVGTRTPAVEDEVGDEDREFGDTPESERESLGI